MADQEQERLRAASAGQDGWGSYASATGQIRYAALLPAPYNRVRCDCGCGGRETHSGMANGLALCSGCELRIRRWVRDGYDTWDTGFVCPDKHMHTGKLSPALRREGYRLGLCRCGKRRAVRA